MGISDVHTVLAEVTRPDICSYAEFNRRFRKRHGGREISETRDWPRIGGLLEEAADEIEAMTGRRLISTLYEYRDSFMPLDGVIDLPVGPISSGYSINWFAFRDGKGQWHRACGSEWYVDSTAHPPRIELCDPDYGLSRTSKYDRVSLASMTGFKVVFRAGYGDCMSAVPTELRHAIISLADARFCSRDGEATEHEMHAIEMLIARFIAVKPGVADRHPRLTRGANLEAAE